MISVIVNTCNEEKYLERCLESLKWADEIVIIDMHSTDRSVEIAKKYTDKIFFHEKTISVLYARDFSLTKAQGDWILIMDPDEVIPAALADKLKEIANTNPEYVAVALPAAMVCFGKRLKYVFPVQSKVRFFKKGFVSFPHKVHAHPVVKGDTYFLPEDDRYIFMHYVADNASRLVEKMNRYTTDEAKHMYKDDGIRFSLWNLLKKPIAEFYYRFFKGKGYKDGRVGFLFSVYMSIYRFKTYAKLWKIGKK